MKLKVVTLCSGYDSQCMALERIKEINHDFDYELTAWSEIDKYAIQAHNAVFPQWKDRNLGDMTKIDWQRERERTAMRSVVLLNSLPYKRYAYSDKGWLQEDCRCRGRR